MEEARTKLMQQAPCLYPEITVKAYRGMTAARLRDDVREAMWAAKTVPSVSISRFLMVAKNQKSYEDVVKVAKRYVTIEEQA
jgi:hypothetical protein